MKWKVLLINIINLSEKINGMELIGLNGSIIPNKLINIIIWYKNDKLNLILIKI